MTRIMIEDADGTKVIVESERGDLSVGEIVDIFGGMLIQCTYSYKNVCEHLNTENYNPKMVKDEA